MVFAIFGLMFLGIIWGLIVSRGFRVFVGLSAVAGVVWIMIANDRVDKQKATDDAAAKTSSERHKVRQTELWSRVPANRVELRSPQLSPERFGEDQFRFSGSIKNLSDQQLGAFEIDVTARDCPVNEKCEVIGNATEVFWAETPPQQVRGISGKVTFQNLPQLRGKLTPQFMVKRVYAGGMLDEWDIGDQK
jgi:hypothetical protein